MQTQQVCEGARAGSDFEGSEGDVWGLDSVRSDSTTLLAGGEGCE